MSSGIWHHVTNLLPLSSGQVCITTGLTSQCRQSAGASERSVHFHQTIRRHVPQDINHYHHKNMKNLLALIYCEDEGATNVWNVRKYSDNNNGWRHIQDDLTFSHTVVRSSDHSLTQITHALTQITHSFPYSDHTLTDSDHSLTHSDHSHSLTQITLTLTQITLTHLLTHSLTHWHFHTNSRQQSAPHHNSPQYNTKLYI
jgi:hypothetical protein